MVDELSTQTFVTLHPNGIKPGPNRFEPGPNGFNPGPNGFKPGPSEISSKDIDLNLNMINKSSLKHTNLYNILLSDLTLKSRYI